MNTIQIKKSDLAATLQKALKYAGSTDWDVYVNAQGLLDVRHNTHDNRDWYEIIDLYSADLENDGKYPNDDGYNYRSSAEWIVFNYGGWLPEYVVILDGKYTETCIKIELID